VGEILKRVPSKQLMAVYKVGAFAGVDQFLQLIAAARGKLKKGGIVDVEVRCTWQHICIIHFCVYNACRPVVLQL
jgi:hypothetical protein